MGSTDFRVRGIIFLYNSTNDLTFYWLTRIPFGTRFSNFCFSNDGSSRHTQVQAIIRAARSILGISEDGQTFTLIRIPKVILSICQPYDSTSLSNTSFFPAFFPRGRLPAMIFQMGQIWYSPLPPCTSYCSWQPSSYICQVFRQMRWILIPRDRNSLSN